MEQDSHLESVKLFEYRPGELQIDCPPQLEGNAPKTSHESTIYAVVSHNIAVSLSTVKAIVTLNKYIVLLYEHWMSDK